MAQELAKCGAQVEVKENCVVVTKRDLHSPTQTLLSHNDHRIAMSLAVLMTKYGGQIDGAEAVKRVTRTFGATLKEWGRTYMKFDENTKILIVGLGLIGGSYARALTEKVLKRARSTSIKRR